MTRTAISPRLAIRIFFSTERNTGAVSTPDATRPHQWHVEVVDETGSTNEDLFAAARAGAPDRSVLRARHQTFGRGRLDRRWESPPDANLLVSLLFRDVPASPHELTHRVALAALAAIERTTGRRPELKWPNDLLLDGRKLAGLLAEADGSGEIEFVVVGIGINVGWGAPGAASLDGATTPDDLLAAMLTAYDELSGDVHDRYRARLATIGTRVRVERPVGDLVGTAVDVEPDGRLVIVDDAGVTHRLSVGDVTHLRPH
jgi:BirA family transcriptional regulator, biotin operon repressor / biotin---[acetyl-CoA-carboxylase] ligase